MNLNSYKIYLDVCCLNRLYDDQTQLRIRLETEAITEILACCQSGQGELIISTVLESEIDKTPDINRKQQLAQSLLIGKNKIIVTKKMSERARELTTLSFKNYDALHLVCAENGADIFLTTDDRLLRKSLLYQEKLKITVNNPVKWLLEINQEIE